MYVVSVKVHTLGHLRVTFTSPYCTKFDTPTGKFNSSSAIGQFIDNDDLKLVIVLYQSRLDEVGVYPFRDSETVFLGFLKSKKKLKNNHEIPRKKDSMKKYETEPVRDHAFE